MSSKTDEAPFRRLLDWPNGHLYLYDIRNIVKIQQKRLSVRPLLKIN